MTATSGPEDTSAIDDRLPVPDGELPGGLVGSVYGAILDAILSGKLAPGHRLREIPISDQFGVSTTPVREALRRLESAGLVEVLPRRGAVVATLNAEDVDDLYEVRLLLEAGAARLAAQNVEKDFAEIDELIARMREVVENPDQVEFNQLDVQLHRAISEMSGNRKLAEISVHTHRRIQAVRVRCSVHLPGRPGVSHLEHLDIVIALKAGDADAAEAAVIRHIASVRAAVAAALSRG